MLLNREPNFFLLCMTNNIVKFFNNWLSVRGGGGVINGGTVLILVSDEISSLWIDVWMSLDEKHFFCPKDT